MNSADLLNLNVKHSVFGIGVISEVSGNYLTIKFAEKVSKFLYPDVFENFIVAEDASVQAQIMVEINKTKLAAELERKIIEVSRNEEKARLAAEKQVITGRNRRNIEDGFGPDYNVKFLSKNQILTYKEVEEQFGIRIAGFGRGINPTLSTIVLISSVGKKKVGYVYHDRWTSDGDFIYSGEGKTGDQKFTLGNKEIIVAEHNGKPIHLFVKFSPQEYYYQGVFSLVDFSYEDEKDESGYIRKEIKFRLRKKLAEDMIKNKLK